MAETLVAPPPSGSHRRTVGKLPASTTAFFRPVNFFSYFIALIAVAGFALSEGNGGILVLGLVACVAAWWLVERSARPAVPRIFINAGVLLAAVVFFYQIFSGGADNVLIALGHFMIFILLCKLFELKTSRDFAQIIALSLLILVTAAIYSSSFLFALIVLIFAVATLYALLYLHLRTESLRSVERRIAVAAPPVLQRGATDIRRVAASAVVPLALIAAFVFLVTPRVPHSNLFSGLSVEGALDTGFSDTVHLYEDGRITQSYAVAMQVSLQDPNGANIGSEYYQPYFRGRTLDSYDPIDHRWLAAPEDTERDGKEEASDGTIHISPGPIGESNTVTQNYTLEISPGGTLFTLDDPLRISSDDFSAVYFNESDGTVAAARGAHAPLKYTVISHAVPHSPPGAPFVTPGDLGEFYFRGSPRGLHHSVVPPLVMSLARKLAGNLAPPPGQHPQPAQVRPLAERFCNYLRTTYPYSLTFNTVDHSIDPTADFLLNRKATGGHCEFFASAMVMLCRAVGINARMVTGYHGGDYNALGAFYIVRQLDAHAWTEVYLPGHGWLSYDPSPATVAASSEADGIGRWFREVGEIIQQGWLSHVVSFDNASRANLFTDAFHFFASAISAVRQGVTGFIFGIGAFAVGIAELVSTSSGISADLRITSFACLAIILALAFWLIHRVYRRRTSELARMLRSVNRRDYPALAAELAFFDELMRLLRRTGIRKSPFQTPAEYVDGLSPQLAAAADDARWLVSTFYALRFGTVGLNDPLRTQIDGALRRLRAGIGKTPHKLTGTIRFNR